MAGAERHLRAETDIVPRPRRSPVIGLLYGYLAIHDDRLKSILPLRIPIMERHWSCLKRGFERQTGKHSLQCEPVELRLLDITFHITFAYHERVIRQVRKHRFQNLRILFRKRVNADLYLYVIATVHFHCPPPARLPPHYF